MGNGATEEILAIDPRLTDEELVHLLRDAADGDTRLFEELVRRYESKVLTNCRYLSGSRDDAEDLAQEVFVKVYFGLARFEGRSSLETWVRRIKSNHCLSFLKKRRIRTVDVDDATIAHAASRPPEVERAMERAGTRERIGEVLMQMSETLRVPLVLRDMDGLAYEAIADELGIGLSAVKMRIKRAREEFRCLFVRTDEEIPAGAGG